jgi:hypothetical protein
MATTTNMAAATAATAAPAALLSAAAVHDAVIYMPESDKNLSSLKILKLCKFFGVSSNSPFSIVDTHTHTHTHSAQRVTYICALRCCSLFAYNFAYACARNLHLFFDAASRRGIFFYGKNVSPLFLCACSDAPHDDKRQQRMPCARCAYAAQAHYSLFIIHYSLKKGDNADALTK